jgi:hypothetical protein
MDLHSLGFTDADLRRLLLDNSVNEDELPKPQKATRTQIGQVFAWGTHRLVCGDSCEQATWDLLLKDQCGDIVISSPPRFNNLRMGSWACYDDFCTDMQTAIRYVSEYLE